jgi:hypothetical protein
VEGAFFKLNRLIAAMKYAQSTIENVALVPIVYFVSSGAGEPLPGSSYAFKLIKMMQAPS